MSYIFILISTVLFSCQSIFSQGYSRLHGGSLESSLLYSSGTNFASFCLMLILSGFQINFSWFSFFTAIAYSFITILAVYCSMNALKTANLSVQSMFHMLGGMLLPFLYGVSVCGEPLTVFKLLCCVLIAAALLLTRNKLTVNKKAAKYYIACLS